MSAQEELEVRVHAGSRRSGELQTERCIACAKGFLDWKTPEPRRFQPFFAVSLYSRREGNKKKTVWNLSQGLFQEFRKTKEQKQPPAWEFLSFAPVREAFFFFFWSRILLRTVGIET